MMIEYLIFFGLLGLGLILFVLHSQKKNDGPIVSNPRSLCESPIERHLYDALTFCGYNVEPQVKCGPYRIDLTLPAYKIAIECDGKQYHSSPEQKAHDRRKDRYLKQHGWRVFRFSGRRIYRDTSGIIQTIRQAMS